MGRYKKKLIEEVLMESSGAAPYIRAVARLRNISAAAEELGVTQPALSARIKKVEKQLGASLFDRSKSPLVITEVGRAYLESQDEIDAVHRELMRKIASIEDLEAGKLVLGGATFFNITYLPKAVAAFSKKYPGIEICIVDDTVPALTEMALNGQLDLFITPFESSNSGLVYQEFLSEKVLLCLPPDAPEVSRLPEPGPEGYAVLAPEHFNLLEDVCFIQLSNTQQIGRKMSELFKRHKFTPKKIVQCDQTMTSLSLTLAGVGAALITETSLQNGGLKNLPAMYLTDEDICTRSLYVAQPKGDAPSRAAEEFIKVLREVN